MAAAVAALASAGVAVDAHAQNSRSTPSPFSSTAFGDSASAGSATLSPTPQRKSLQWDSKGRWGLKFDYQTAPVNGPDFGREMDAGVTYKLTPHLHIGGMLGMSEQPLAHIATPDQAPAPRVRLETTFKF